MSQIILMSIRPEWVAKILNGEKTIEVRKHALKEGDVVHIYCTKAKPNLLKDSSGYGEYANALSFMYEPMNGKVVAKFIVGKCENINIAESDFFYTSSLNSHSLYKKSCLSYGELLEYLASGRFGAFAIEITQLEIFDRPRELHDYFKQDISEAMTHWEYERATGCKAPCPADVFRITHAPQSFMSAWIDD